MYAIVANQAADKLGYFHQAGLDYNNSNKGAGLSASM